jgi:hypothetical protein
VARHEAAVNPLARSGWGVIARAPAAYNVSSRMIEGGRKDGCRIEPGDGALVIHSLWASE